MPGAVSLVPETRSRAASVILLRCWSGWNRRVLALESLFWCRTLAGRQRLSFSALLMAAVNLSGDLTARHSTPCTTDIGGTTRDDALPPKRPPAPSIDRRQTLTTRSRPH